MQTEAARPPIVVRRPEFALSRELPAHWNGNAFASHVEWYLYRKAAFGLIQQET